jgi:hypothetical protein
MESLNRPGITPAIERRVAGIDTETLTAVVRAILGDSGAIVDEWNRTTIPAGVGGGYFGTALFRFDGTATTSSGIHEWSVVLKILAERPGEEPSGHPYWKREAEAYRSDILRDVPGEFIRADVYRIEEFPGESVWLWLEDVDDEHGGEWPLDQYRRTAHHLGQFNGTFLTGADLPSEPWIVERTFDFSKTAGVVALVDTVPGDSTVQRLFPTHADRERFVAAREDLPKTFCHFDAFGRNLFATTTRDERSRTVAIDWDQCGAARIGDDAGALVVLTLIFLDWPVARADDLEEVVLRGYRDGLASVGWDGPENVVLEGYRLHVINRWLEWVGGVVRLLIDERNHDWMVDMSGNPIEVTLRGCRDLNRFVLNTVDELDLETSDPPSEETVP